MRIEIALAILGAVLNALAQVGMKYALHGLPPMRWDTCLDWGPRLLLRPMFLAALTLYVISLVNWVVVLSRLELSIAYPIMSLALVLTFAAGVLAFGEQITLARLLGAAAIILGAVLISRPAPAA